MSNDNDLLALVLDSRLRALLDEYDVELSASVPAERVAALREALRCELDQRRMHEDSAQKLMALGELVAGTVHEVRNMVTSIRGFSQVARRKQGNNEQLGTLLATIEREATRCAEVTGTFLRFARQGGAHREPISVDKIVCLVGDLVRHQLRIHDIDLSLDVADELPALEVDRNEVVQSLINLVLNAQQAIGRGGSVAVAAAPSGTGVQIEITDSGPGVPTALRERIFDPFFTTKPDGEGTGLGLTVSSRMIEANGGTLSLVGEDGSGARFVVWLPGIAG